MSPAPSSDCVLDAVLIAEVLSALMDFIPLCSSLSLRYCSTASVNCCLRHVKSVLLDSMSIGVIGEAGLLSLSSLSESVLLGNLMLLIPLSGDPVIG